MKIPKVEVPEKNNLPSPESFYLLTSLYQSFAVNHFEVQELKEILYFSGTIDCYCTQ